VSVDVSTRVNFRLLGRSYVAFVLAPEPPFEEWLTELDRRMLKSASFFTNRPVILDLGVLSPGSSDVLEIVTTLEARGLRIVAVEGVDAMSLPPRLAPLPGTPMPIGMFDPAKQVATASGKPVKYSFDPLASEKHAKVSTLLLEEPLRSGQSIIFPEGDVTIVGSVASGAEVVAGGSIHVYGALRGRAFAGTAGNTKARIFCNKFDAEILVIDGLYKTADDFDPALRGEQVQARLERDVLSIEAFN
jgi:septum site-determining protein MinC